MWANMKRALGFLIVLTIFTSALSTRDGNNRYYQNKWRGHSENSEYPKIVEVVRWRQSVCVLPGPNVPPCFTALRKYQDDYEAISGEEIEPNSEHRDERKTLKKTRATSLDNIDVENGVTKILTPRITNFIYVDAFPSDKLQSSENPNYRDLSVHSSTPEIDHAYVRREGRYLVFSPLKTEPTVAKTRPEITVTKVLNSPVTATLVANNCFPDIGVPLCNDYPETIPASAKPSSESIARDPEKAPCVSSSCSSSSSTPSSSTPGPESDESVSEAIVQTEIKPQGTTQGQSHPVEVASSRPKPGFVSAIYDVPKPIFAHFGGDVFDKKNETPVLNVNRDTVRAHDYDKKTSAEITQGQAAKPRVTVVNGEPVLQSALAGKPAKQPIFFEHFWRTGDVFRKKVFITTTGAHRTHDSDVKYTGNHGKTEKLGGRADNRKKFDASTQGPEYFGGYFKNFTRPCTVNKSIEKMKNLWGFSKSYLPDLHSKRIIFNRPGAKSLLVQKMMNVSEKLAPGGLFGLRATADGRPLFDINHEMNKEYAHVDMNPSSGVLSRVFSTVYRPGYIQHSFSIRKQKPSENEKNLTANVQPENGSSEIHPINGSTNIDNDEKTACAESPKIEEITVTIVKATDRKSKNEEKIQITKETIDETIDAPSEIAKIPEAENSTKVESTFSAVDDNDEKSKDNENTEVTKEKIVEVGEKPDEITGENIFIDGETSLSISTDGKLTQDGNIEDATEMNDRRTDGVDEKVEIPENNDTNEKEISSVADNDENFEHNTVVANKTIEKDITKVSEGVDFFEEGTPDFNVTDQASKDDENTEIATTILEALAEELDRMSKISEYDDVTAEDIMSSGLDETHRELEDNKDSEKTEKKLAEIREKKGENPEEIEKTIQAITEDSVEATKVPENEKLPSVFNITTQEPIQEEDAEVATEEIQKITENPEQISKASEDLIVIGEKNSSSVSSVSEQTSNPHDNVEVNKETSQETTEGPVEIAKGTENVVTGVTGEDLLSTVDKNGHRLNLEEDAEVTTETIQEITGGPVEIEKGTENLVANVTEEVLSSVHDTNDHEWNSDEDAEVTTETIQEITEGPVEIAKGTENVVAGVTEEVLLSTVDKKDQRLNLEDDVEVATEAIQEITEGPAEIAKSTENVVVGITEEFLSSTVDKNDQKTDLEDAEVTTEIIQEITEEPAEIGDDTEIVVGDVTEQVVSTAVNKNDQKVNPEEDAGITTETIQEITEGPVETADGKDEIASTDTEEVISSTVSNNDEKIDLEEDAEVTTEIVQEIIEEPAEIAKNTEIVVADVTEEVASSAANKNDQKTDVDEDAEVTTEIIQEIIEEPAEIAKKAETAVTAVTEEILSPVVNKNDQKPNPDEDAEVTAEIIQEITEGPAEIAENTENVVADVAEEVLSSTVENNDQKTDLEQDAEVGTGIIQEMTEGPAEIANNTENVMADIAEEVLSSAVNDNYQKTDLAEDAEVTAGTIQQSTVEPVEIAKDTENSGITEEALSPTVIDNDEKTDREKDAEVTAQRTEEIIAEGTNTENIPKDAVVLIDEKSKNTRESKFPDEAETMSTAPEDITTTPANDVKISDQVIVTEASFEDFADIEFSDNTEQIATAPKANFSNSVITKLSIPVETVPSNPGEQNS